MFSGTVKESLDPFNKYQDADVWAALEAVDMRRVVDAMPGDDKLRAMVRNYVARLRKDTARG